MLFTSNTLFSSVSMPKQRLKRKRSKDSANDDRPKKRLRSGDDFMLDSDELRSDDEMQVKPKPKRKLKRKRKHQKTTPIFKKPKQEKPARKKNPVKKNRNRRQQSTVFLSRRSPVRNGRVTKL